MRHLHITIWTTRSSIVVNQTLRNTCPLYDCDSSWLPIGHSWATSTVSLIQLPIHWPASWVHSAANSSTKTALEIRFKNRQLWLLIDEQFFGWKPHTVHWKPKCPSFSLSLTFLKTRLKLKHDKLESVCAQVANFWLLSCKRKWRKQLSCSLLHSPSHFPYFLSSLA